MRVRTCGRPGCRGIIRDDVCDRCGSAHRWRDPLRPTQAQRGYDQAWVKTRQAFIIQKILEAAMSGISAYPICEICTKPIIDEVHVDHRVPFKGIDDPLRLDFSNLRTLHRDCHMKHTAKGSHRMD